jgi:hypothetical protein
MLEKLKRIYNEGGVISVLRKSLELIVRGTKYASKAIYFKVSPTGTFNFNGRELKYFRHNYNLAYDNERTVEIAIVSAFLKSLGRSAKVLEVGNVLANYGFRHAARNVLDKYDPAPHVFNEDVISFKPTEKYDAIISISTLEHVGWDEDVRDPVKIITAVRNLTENCLAPGGCMLVTIPLGYNTYFDDQLAEGAEYFTEKYFLKRVSADNKWRQVDYAEVAGSKFGQPFNNANAMCIGIVRV